MKEIKEWNYKYPGESQVAIRVGDWFTISRIGRSGKRFDSCWMVVDILNEPRLSEVGIVTQKTIVARFNNGKYINQWQELRDMRGKNLKLDDFVVAHRLRARKGESA